MPQHLRNAHGLHRFHFEGLEHLRGSIQARAGIMLTPNHCRWADPFVLGVMANRIGQFLYYMASYHLFKQGAVRGWLLRRLGGFSIWREGTDREAIRTAVQILADAERPLVLFPEGTWLRQNDRVLELQEGVSLILRQAIKQGERPLMVHPVGVKYWMLEDPGRAAGRRLSALERSLGWSPQAHLPPIARIEQIGMALLSLRETELLGSPQHGHLDERAERLVVSQVERLEKQHFCKAHDGWSLERVRRLRQHLMRKLLEEQTNEAASQAIRRDLDILLLCENLTGHALAYLHESPTHERLVETVQRFEETITDLPEVPIVPMGVTVRVGPAIDARQLFGGGRGERGKDPLMSLLRPRMQGLIDGQLAQGPPRMWNCPKPPTSPRFSPAPVHSHAGYPH
jgi:1-acyl-sn-glycerol-3-phosphate acyltransferase